MIIYYYTLENKCQRCNMDPPLYLMEILRKTGECQVMALYFGSLSTTFHEVSIIKE